MPLTLIYALCTVALLTRGATAAPSSLTEPPSSLEPEGKTRNVRLSHRHRRVVSCEESKKAGTSGCIPTFKEADSATRIRLLRLFQRISSVTSDNAVVVDFPSEVGRQQRSVPLRLGRWQIDWGSSVGPNLFSVSADFAPEIVLETRSGECQALDSGCRVTQAVRRKVSLN
jgi:hypothetical protein